MGVGGRWPGDDHGWEATDAPRLKPLSYPGRWPTESILLTRDARYDLQLQPAQGLGRARIVLGDEALPLDDALIRQSSPRAEVRTPVLAVGSNAAPSQLRFKFDRAGVSTVVPLLLAAVEGLAASYAAHLSAVGYIPATAVTGPGLSSRLFVQWLDADQLAAMDRSEPGYRRVLIPAGDPALGGVRVTLPSGEVLGACYAYVETRGHLVTDSGAALQLTDQRALLVGLLDRSRRLQSLMGTSAESWLDRATDPGLRAAVDQLFVDEGWAVHDAALTALAEEQAAPPCGVDA